MPLLRSGPKCRDTILLMFFSVEINVQSQARTQHTSPEAQTHTMFMLITNNDNQETR